MTMAMWSLRNSGTRSAIGASAEIVSSRVTITSSTGRAKTLFASPGSVSSAASTSLSSTRPTTWPRSSTTGSCETSAERMRANTAQIILRPHNDGIAFAVAAHHHVAHGAVAAAVGPAFLCQEDRIEYLGQIFGAGIADEADDALGRGLRAAIAQRRREQRARGGAGENALRAQEIARAGEGLAVRDRERVRDEAEIGDRRHEILADALDRPAANRDHPSGLDQWREYRAFRIGEDHRGLG